MTGRGHKALARLLARARHERGLTLIEVLVAMLVLLIGMLGALGALSGSTDAIQAADTSAVLTQAAENELQTIEALPYNEIANDAVPVKTTSTDTTNPTYYLVSGCSAASCSFEWNQSNLGVTEPVDIDTTNGQVAPGPTTEVVTAPTASGCTTVSTSTCRISVAVYAYVTETTDAVCSLSGVTCSGSYSYKRITVAVKNLKSGAPRKPVYLSTFINQKAGGSANPLYGATGASSATTCTDGGITVACTH